MTTHYRNATPEGMPHMDTPSFSHFWDNVRHAVESIPRNLHQWLERAQDIGISRNEAKREYSKPFWKA